MRVFVRKPSGSKRATSAGPATLDRDRGRRSVAVNGSAPFRVGHDFSLIPVHSPPPVNLRVSARNLRSLGIYPKLAIGDSEDAVEREAGRVADQVSNVPWHRFEPPRIPIANVIEGSVGIPAVVNEVLRNSGQPLDPTTRAFMEPRFGHDFSKVRIHTDRRAAMSASVISAHAYTAGNDIVFGAGRHRPDSKEGRHLLAHELTHVVQQTRQPFGTIRRQPSKDDDKKTKRVAHHKRQQKLVAGFLADALKIKPKSTKDPLDPDNLFRNTAQLVDPPKTAKASLKVLTPTHYSTHDVPVYFDAKIAHPQIGGDYPADPATRVAAGAPGSSLVTPVGPDVGAQTGLQPQPTGISSPPKKEEPTVERVPYKQSTDPEREPSPPKTAPPAQGSGSSFATWSPAEIKLFIGNGEGTSTADITLDEFKTNLVHEGQHVADWSLQKADTVDWKRALEHYKSEFRAFSIQPPQDSFGNPKPIGASTVRPNIPLTSAQKCDACGGTASAPTTQPTAMKNERQERIFLNLITSYPHERFDCFYVCNRDFRDAVNDYDSPSSMNLVNSTRLIDVSIAVQGLTPSMTRAEVGKTNLQSAVERLDRIDWTFLKDEKLSDPFWMSVKDAAPLPVFEALKALAKKGPPRAKDVSKGLKKALEQLK